MSDDGDSVDYADMTVKEIREVLRGRGLPIYGNKATLLGRLGVTMDDDDSYQYEVPDLPPPLVDDTDSVIPQALREATTTAREKRSPEVVARQTGEFMGFSHRAIVAPSLQRWGRAVTGDDELAVKYSDADIQTISTAWEMASLEYGWTAPIPVWGVLLMVEAAATLPIYAGIRQAAIQEGRWKPQKPKIRRWLKRLRFWRRRTPDEVSGGRVGGRES